MSENRPLVSIVMPAFNEEANIERTVRRSVKAIEAVGYHGEVVVTDDGSRDGTRKVLSDLEQDLSNLVVVEHATNMGYGAALKSAIMASRGEYIVTIDSDGQFDIEELPVFFSEANGTAVVTGFRKKKQDTAFRVFANRGLNGLISLLFGVRFSDINCAFRMYRGDVLRSINIESAGYQAPSEIMIKLTKLGCDVKEVAVTHLARDGGQSALKPIKTITQMTGFLVYLKMKTVLYKKGILNSL